MADGYGAAAVLTRTADTNAYTANDVIGRATGASAALQFDGFPPGSHIMITSVRLEIDDTGVISGETSYRLYLYGLSPASALGDNAAFDLPAGDRADFRGYVDLGTPVDLGSTLYVETNIVNKEIGLTAGQTSIYGYLVTNGGYTPSASRVYKITLQAVVL